MTDIVDPPVVVRSGDDLVLPVTVTDPDGPVDLTGASLAAPVRVAGHDSQGYRLEPSIGSASPSMPEPPSSSEGNPT